MRNSKSTKNPANKKHWQKPLIITITQKELKDYIRAAANSGSCAHGFGR